MRRFAVVVGSIAAVFVLVVIWALLDATGGASSRTVWNHTWSNIRGAELGGYLTGPEGPDSAKRRMTVARPPQDERLPAILLLHDRFGLTLEYTILADSIAADGFVVLAADYLRGDIATGVPGAIAQTRMAGDDQISKDIDRALMELKSVSYVDTSRIAVVGLRFGGQRAIELGVRDATLKAVVAVSPDVPIVDDRDLGLLGSKGSVMVIYGSKDRNADSDKISAFESLMTARNIPYVVQTFDGARAGFLDLDSIRAGGPARDAWNLLRAFLQRSLY